MSSIVSVAKGRIYRRKDGKYFIYIPAKLAEDSMLPFRGEKDRYETRSKG